MEIHKKVVNTLVFFEESRTLLHKRYIASENDQIQSIILVIVTKTKLLFPNPVTFGKDIFTNHDFGCPPLQMPTSPPFLLHALATFGHHHF